VSPDKLEDATRIIQDAIPTLKQANGFKGLLLLADRATGKGQLVALWESEAAMEASNSLRQEVLAKAAPLLVGAPTAEVYEVLAPAYAPQAAAARQRCHPPLAAA
jgi:quinol monooxygenase YgiN